VRTDLPGGGRRWSVRVDRGADVHDLVVALAGPIPADALVTAASTDVPGITGLAVELVIEAGACGDPQLPRSAAPQAVAEVAA
jgi:hypothetical protein